MRSFFRIFNRKEVIYVANEVDTLEVKVEAQARGANSQLERLVGNLQSVNSALQGTENGGLISLANGVNILGSAMQSMSNIKTTDFNRLAKGIQKLGGINATSLSSAASSINEFVSSMNGIQGVSENSVAVGELSKNIAKLGNKSVATAIQNIPQLSSALKQMMQVLSGAPDVSENVIKMTSAMSSLAANGKKVESASKNLSTGFEQYTESTRKATSGSRSLESVIRNLYTNYFKVVRAFKGLGSAIKSSMDYIEEYNYFNVVTGKIASEWSKDYEKYGYDNAESYGNSFRTRLTDLMSKMSGYQINDNGTLTDTQSSNLGLDITGLTNYSAGLMQVTNSLGLTGEASESTAKALTMLAGDMSSFRNTPLKEVMTNMQSGLIGQSRALYKYGIDITNATLANYALANGVTKSISEMSQSEKMQLRMIAILDQSKVAYGDLANTIESPSNQLRMLQNNFIALARIIGEIFMPIVAKVLPYINGLVIAIRRLFSWVASLLGVDLSGIIDNSGAGYSSAFEDMADDADNASNAIDGTKNSAKELKNELMGFDEVNKLSENTDSSGSGSKSKEKGSGTPIDLTNQLNDALNDYEGAWNKAFAGMNNTANKYADNIENFFKGVAKYAEPSVDAVKRLWSDGLKKFNNFQYENAKNFLNDFLIPLGKWTLGKGLPDLVDATNDFLKEIDWNRLSSNLDKFYKAIEPFAEGVGNGLIKFYKGITAIGANLINLCGDAIGGFASTLLKIGPNNIEKLGEAFGVLLGSIALFKTVSVVVGILGDLKGGFVKFLVAMVEHPAVVVATAIIALTAAIVGFTGGVDSNAVKIATSALVGLATGVAVFKAMSAVPQIVELLKSSMGGLIGLLAGNPVTLGIAAVTGLTVALITFMDLSKSAEGDCTTLSNAVKSVVDATNNSVSAVLQQKDSVDATYGAVKNIADKYFELADRFDTLSDSEKEMLKTYASYLVDKCPELADSINTVTGEFTGQKDEVYKTINALQAYAKAAAMEDVLKDLYEQQYKVEKELKDSNGQYTKAESIIYKYAKQLTGMSKDAFNAAYEVGGLGEAFDVVATKISDAGGNAGDFRKEVGLTSEDVWSLSNGNKALKDSLDKCNGAIDDAATTAARATAEYKKLKDGQDENSDSSNNMARTHEVNDQRMLESAQTTNSLISQSVHTSTDNSFADVLRFYSNSNNTLMQLGTTGASSGTALSTNFMAMTSGLPLYNSGIFQQIHDIAQNGGFNSGNDSGQSLVDQYKSKVDGIPNTTAVAFLGIMDAVNTGQIGIDKADDLMDNLAAEIGTKKWAVHEAFTNALAGSYQAHLSGDDSGSVGDPMTSGFMHFQFKANGGPVDRGQMFIARESGPELVGTMGGHTAVANNDQIVESVSQGVASAVYNVVAPLLSNGNSGNTPINIYVGGKQITDVVVEDVNGRTRSTGVCPILT